MPLCRFRERWISIEVEIADLEDNTDIRRLQELDDKATARSLPSTSSTGERTKILGR